MPRYPLSGKTPRPDTDNMKTQLKLRHIAPMLVVHLSDLATAMPELQEIADLYAIPDELEDMTHHYWSQSLHLVPLEDFASYLSAEQEQALRVVVQTERQLTSDELEDLHVLLNA